MNERFLYPRKIPLNKTLCFSKRRSYAFGALIGTVFVSEADGKTTHDLSLSPEFQFHHKGESHTDLTFEDVEFHSAYASKTNDCFRVLKSAIFQCITSQCFGLSESFDFYDNPSLIVELGFIGDVDIHVIANLRKNDGRTE